MLYYEVEGEGKSFVFLHGFLENHSIWNNLRADLKDQHQIITLDLPGHGNSETDNEENTMEELADEVIAVLDVLNIAQANFIGHSMGGYVACALADLYPERVENIVLLNSSTLADDDAKKNQRLRTCETARKNFKALVNFSMPSLFAAHHRENFKNDLNKIKEIALTTPITGVCAALKGMRLRPDRSSVLYDFKGGIYIVVGMND